MQRFDFVQPEHLWGLGGSESGTVNGAVYFLAFNGFQCVDNGHNGQGGIRSGLQSGNQIVDHAVIKKRARRIVNSDQTGISASKRVKTGAH
jgi:hypothetical protein